METSPGQNVTVQCHQSDYYPSLDSGPEYMTLWEQDLEVLPETPLPLNESSQP